MKTNRKKKKTKKRSKRCRQSTQIKYQNMNIFFVQEEHQLENATTLRGNILPSISRSGKM